MDLFEKLEKLYAELYLTDTLVKDYQEKQKAIKKQIADYEMKAIEKLIEEKEQGSTGHIVGNTVYSYMRVNPKPIITDESKIPERFWKVERTIKKAEINQAIKDGDAIDGVSFDNGGYALTRKTNLKG